MHSSSKKTPRSLPFPETPIKFNSERWRKKTPCFCFIIIVCFWLLCLGTERWHKKKNTLVSQNVSMHCMLTITQLWANLLCGHFQSGHKFCSGAFFLTFIALGMLAKPKKINIYITYIFTLRHLCCFLLYLQHMTSENVKLYVNELHVVHAVHWRSSHLIPSWKYCNPCIVTRNNMIFLWTKCSCIVWLNAPSAAEVRGPPFLKLHLHYTKRTRKRNFSLTLAVDECEKQVRFSKNHFKAIPITLSFFNF